MQGCRKGFPPNDPEVTQGVCSTLWVAAEEAYNRYRAMFTDAIPLTYADQIHVIDEGDPDPRNKEICYNYLVYVVDGWCKVSGQELSMNAWGICSSSCKYFVCITKFIIIHLPILKLISASLWKQLYIIVLYIQL